MAVEIADEDKWLYGDSLEEGERNTPSCFSVFTVFSIVQSGRFLQQTKRRRISKKMEGGRSLVV